MDKNTPRLIKQKQKDKNAPGFIFFLSQILCSTFFFTYPFLLFFVSLLLHTSSSSSLFHSVFHKLVCFKLICSILFDSRPCFKFKFKFKPNSPPSSFRNINPVVPYTPFESQHQPPRRHNQSQSS